MSKNLFGNLLICSLILVGCERSSLSPVEIKLDGDLAGYMPVKEITNTYVVKENETLFDIANKFNIDPMNLAQINGIKSPYNVKKGQVLKLPPDSSAQAAEDTLAQYNAVNIDEKNSETSETKKNEEKDRLDNSFQEIMAEKKEEKNSNKTAVAAAGGKGSSFNEQEAALSSPKITKNVKGADVTTANSANTPTPVEVSGNGMMWPVKGPIVSKYGDMLDGLPNDGVNIKAAAGTKVSAILDGEVLYAGNNLDESFGNVVVLKHDKGYISSYANMGSISVKKGAHIKRGATVGTVGSTGNVSEPQLHFEIMKDNTPLNPEKYLGK